MTPLLITVCSADSARGRKLTDLMQAAGFEIVETGAEVVVLCIELSRPRDVDKLDSLLAASAPVVAVVPRLDRPTLQRAADAGLAGCVVEERAAATLETAIRAVNSGQIVMPRELYGATRPPIFTPREKQVLGMVVLGFGNAEIAAKLFLAESTVKSHLNSSFAKLGVRSRAEAAARILSPENGLGLGILAISD